MKLKHTLLLLLLATCYTSANAEDWPRFRGPNGSGVATDKTPTPTEWTPESVLWKTPIKGAGVSCPIVVGDKVLVTSYSGYGESRGSVGKMDDLKRHLTCFDKNTGKELWSKSVDPVLPEEPFSGMGIPAHGYASHTPVSDGKLVFAFFGRTGVVAFDLDGNKKWTTNVGKGNSPKGWGSASSPIVHGDNVIVPATAEDSAMIALNKETGKEAWKTQADGFYNSWSTPILSKVSDERTDIVFGVGYELWGLNPENGKLRWFAEVHSSDSFNSSIVENGGVIYAVEGRRGGGRDLPSKQVARKTPRITSCGTSTRTGRFHRRLSIRIVFTISQAESSNALMPKMVRKSIRKGCRVLPAEVRVVVVLEEADQVAVDLAVADLAAVEPSMHRQSPRTTCSTTCSPMVRLW